MKGDNKMEIRWCVTYKGSRGYGHRQIYLIDGYYKFTVDREYAEENKKRAEAEGKKDVWVKDYDASP
jgi:hypothetical protein